MPEPSLRDADVFFFITALSQQDVSDFTRIIGLEPSRVMEAGIYNEGRREIIYHWQIVSPLPKSAPVEKHIEALLQMLEPRADAVRSVTERFEAGIHGIVSEYYVDDDDASALMGICLWRPMVKALAALNLQITFDVFFGKKTDES